MLSFSHPMLPQIAVATVAICLTARQVAAEQADSDLSKPAGVPAAARQVAAWGDDSVHVFLADQTLWLAPTEKGIADRRIAMVRLCSPIKSIRWAAAELGEPPKFVPEPNHWEFSWPEGGPRQGRVIQVEFDRRPALPDDCPAAKPDGDGSVMLHAYAARTFGEKLRFEPQWYKNTVGYWTVPEDYATWNLELDRPGQYAVALLQGCGKGQGGSEATISLSDGEQVAAKLSFATVDTGHFQNFRWRHVGLIDVAEPGEFTLAIRPTRIAKGALFDVRAIHLTPQARPAPQSSPAP